MLPFNLLVFVVVVGVVLGQVSGCSGINRLETKAEKVISNSPEGKMVHEGRLQVIRAIGSMSSIQFEDGNVFDVREAPSDLRPGDVVRIYKDNNNVYQARLHRAVKEDNPQNPVK